jgi:hypothetical protein
VIAAGTQITNADLLQTGANVCIQASLNASGQLSAPFSVSANVTSTIEICGTVSGYTAATALPEPHSRTQ